MACILFYSPFNQRSRDTESLMVAFRRQGHRVISLTQQEGREINDFLASKDVEVFSYVVPGPRSGWRYYLRHLIYFIRFCRRHKVDIVYSHLEPANFVASVGQYLIRARTYLCRHHIDEAQLYKFNRDLYYRVTYRLARRIIVVSSQAKKYMVEHEKIEPDRIIHINLAYDFSLYGSANSASVEDIRKRHPAALRLISASRFTEFKRPDLAVRLLQALVVAGIDARLILLGKGEMQEDLELMVRSLNLEDRVFMPGYVSNVLDYLAASDLLVHPSVLDSSCVVVKEAGLVELPVLVCRGIGDFDDYIQHGINGFVVDRDRFLSEAAAVIIENFADKLHLQKMGRNLKESVLRLFSIEQVLHHYDELNKVEG